MKSFDKAISLLLMCTLILAFAFALLNNPQMAYAQLPPQSSMTGKIKVYPDGRVALSGTVNQTLTTPTPTMEGSMEFSKSGALTKISSESSIILSPADAVNFPFEIIDAASTSQYTAASGVYDSAFDLSLILNETIAGQYPLNLIDFSASGQCSNGDFSGDVNVFLLPGFAIGNLALNFEGNQSYMLLDGATTVYYGSYMGMEINATVIDYMIMELETNIAGQGPNSLYNMTNGALECTTMDVTYENITTPQPGALITIRAVEIVSRQGTFFESSMYLIYAVVSGELPTMGNPLPLIIAMTFLPLSMTCEMATSASFEAVYSHSTRQFSVSTDLSMNRDAVMERMLSVISEFLSMPTIPPELTLLQPYLEDILQQNFCYVESSSAHAHYENRVVTIVGADYIAGNVNAAVNYAKGEMLSWVRIIQPWVWQLDYLNQTTIDITQLKYSYKTSGNYFINKIENLILKPPLDSQTATSFQLKRFFNLTFGMPPPTTPFALTVEGTSNITHYMTITRPSNVPPPSSSSTDGKSMTWQISTSVTIDALQDLTFNINTEPDTKGYPITDPESVTENDPFECDAVNLASVKISVKQISCAATIIVKNLTSPPADGETAPANFKFLGRYVEIMCDPSDATVQATIRIYYTDPQLQAAGVDESSLKVFYWNATSKDWEEYETTVNAAENYVEIEVTHFSVWAVLGQEPSPLWTQTWFIAAVIAVVAVIAVAVAYIFMQKRKKTSETPPATQPASPTPPSTDATPSA